MATAAPVEAEKSRHSELKNDIRTVSAQEKALNDKGITVEYHGPLKRDAEFSRAQLKFVISDLDRLGIGDRDEWIELKLGVATRMTSSGGESGHSYSELQFEVRKPDESKESKSKCTFFFPEWAIWNETAMEILRNYFDFTGKAAVPAVTPKNALFQALEVLDENLDQMFNGDMQRNVVLALDQLGDGHKVHHMLIKIKQHISDIK